jgi:hypothetical protein
VSETDDEFPSATRTATPEQEAAASEQLGRLFQIIDIWQASDTNSQGLSVQPGSALVGDDRATNPLQVSHAAIHGIVTAQDHLHALRMLIKKAESLHAFAPFTLDRAAIEGGAVAVWLLAPQSRDERIRRRLVLATQNAFDAHGALKAAGKASSLSDRLNAIRKVASRRHALDPDLIVSRPPGLERMVSEAGDTFELGSEAAVACWKACSGITHSRQWASVSMLDREELNRVANVINLRLTASFSNVLSVTAIAVAFSSEARRLFAKRATTHV